MCVVFGVMLYHPLEAKVIIDNPDTSAAQDAILCGTMYKSKQNILKWKIIIIIITINLQKNSCSSDINCATKSSRILCWRAFSLKDRWMIPPARVYKEMHKVTKMFHIVLHL